MDDRKGKRVVIVTGAGQGLGRAIATVLAEAGHTVFGCGPRGASECRDLPFAMLGCDITDEAQIQAVWTEVTARAGRVDWWINNAGLALTGRSLADLPGADFARMVGINLIGTMNACRIAIAGMKAQGFGEIWNMLGAGADGAGVARMNGYATTKSALAFLTRALAEEAVDACYRIGAISPGLVMTEGFFREHARVPQEQLAAREAVVNVIGDHPETLALWIRDELEAGQENGAVLTWLTTDKIAERRAQIPPRDILSAYR